MKRFFVLLISCLLFLNALALPAAAIDDTSNDQLMVSQTIDYVGLAHYRRHFKGQQKAKDPFDEVLTLKETDALFDHTDIIVPKRRKYYIETIYVPSVQTYGNTKTGTKVAECISSGTTIYTVSVTGTFYYDGSTSEATSASAKIAAYVEGVTLNSKRAYTSGASACAFASVNYNGATLQKTVTLTCDKNGNLS